MLNLVQGCKVPRVNLLSEQYQIRSSEVSAQFLANVNAEKIEDVFQHFIAMQEERLFFILELPTLADEEEKLRKSDHDPMHKDVYYIDGLSREEALTLMIRYGKLLINDGISRFGFGVHDDSAELMLDKYNVVTLWTPQVDKYEDFFPAHNIPKVDECLTAWNTFSEDTPGECSRIDLNGKDVFDLVEELSQWGIYMAERREDE